MIIGTTPDYHLNIKGIDLTEMQVYVTIAQNNKVITLEGSDLEVTASQDGQSVEFSLTQRQTLSLDPGIALVQVKYIDSNGVVGATSIKEIHVERALLKKVIAYDANS